MQNLSLILYILILISTLISAKSLFAPINVFVLLIGFFFSSIFFNHHSFLVYLIYYTILLIVLFHNNLILNTFKPKIYNPVSHSFSYPTNLFFSLLFVILFVLFLFVSKFGGVPGFILASKRGTEEFFGLGHYKTIVNFIYPLGLVSYTFHSFN